nr:MULTISPECIES: hypothetical protein [Mycobacterium]
MLAAIGLERLETGLNDDTVTAADVAEFLDQAEADEVGTLARDGMPEALECFQRRRLEQLDTTLDWIPPVSPPPAVGLGVPARRQIHSRANPQFRPTKQANRV